VPDPQLAFFRLPDGTQLAYVDQGSGPPILFLHGWSSSLKWFHPQLPRLAQRYRVLALDFRGHGDSDKTPDGHTMEQYARDVHAFTAGVGAEGCLMVGWSMGSLVLWNYVLQFGQGQARGMVFVGQSASDLRTPDYEDGIVTPDEFQHMMLRLQTDREALLDGWMRAMRMEATEEDIAWMAADYLRCPAHIATVAFYHQTTVNSLPAFPRIDFPTRVFFGTDPKMYNIGQGEYLARAIPGTRLVVFDRSGHVPQLEEPEKFNHELHTFAQELFGRINEG
jgi:pimeloyl-ACP methyl ester carboxylesterase